MNLKFRSYSFGLPDITINPKITTEELASQIGVTSKTIKRRIAKMTHILYVGSGYSGHGEVKKK